MFKSHRFFILLKQSWNVRYKKRSKGVRLRKTVKGKTISAAVSQISLSVIKHGKKPLAEIFQAQNQPKAEKKAEKPAEKSE
jgi:hypothetical protein